MKKLVLILALMLPNVTLAVQPDEVLSDPVLEARARDISKDLRCLVCQNESIDDSNAPLARDLRLIVRERLVQGDSNDDVKAFIVDRYGEFALLRPSSGGANTILWWSGPLMLVLALIFGGVYLRGRARLSQAPQSELNDDEKRRLDELLKD